MRKIDEKRVVLGGVAAGLVLVAGGALVHRLTGYEGAVALFSAGQDRLQGAFELFAYTTFHLSIGLPVVWLYAVLKSRFGPGPRTALRAGFVGWWLAFLVHLPFQGARGAYDSGQIGGTVIATMAASAALYAVAALVGAWLYRDPEPAAPSAESTVSPRAA